MSALKITKDTFRQEVLESKKPVLVDFFAEWCGPCRTVLPIVDEIASERDDFKVVKVNIDEQPELASESRVMTIPTLMVVKNGKIVNKAMGSKRKPQILSMMK